MTLSLRQKILRSLLTVLPFVLFIPLDALACSCMSPRPPCEAFSNAAAVFVGRAVSAAIQHESEDKKGNKKVYLGGKVHFAVETAYSGRIGKEVDIRSGIGGGDCGYFFESGGMYLVYAYGSVKEGFTTSICTRTKLLSNAYEDLNYLQNLPPPGSKASLKGIVFQDVTYYGENQPPKYDGLSGIEISLKPSRGQAMKTVTDDEGKYEFKGLKSGTYIVSAALPKHYKQGDDFSREEVTINDRGCKEVTVMFKAVFDGSLSGVVTDTNDKPVTNGTVALLPANSDQKLGFFWENPRGYINKDGSFEFGSLSPGRYLLGINVNSNSDQEMPYPPTWYPGVPEQTQATIIEISPGQKLSGLVFKLSSKLTSRTIKGLVVWPNGKPAAKASIHLESDEYPGWCVNNCGNADENGQFTLIGFEGYKYFIQADADITTEADYKDRQSIYAVPVLIELGKEDISGLKIVLTLDQKTYEERHKRKRD